MNLSAYLDRIRFEGPARADLETLNRVHLAHQLTVPFENLDVQLRRPLTLDVNSSFDKIVTRRRGGWCYEMNGVLGWALSQIGFQVQRLSAGVMRERLGDQPLGNHLCLLVRLDRPYLVDVGFGGSLAAPLPLHAGAERKDTPYRISLSEAAEGYWRFSEIAQSDPFSFDFRLDAADEGLFARKCASLQSDPASSFVQNLVVQRRTLDTHVGLRGRVLTTIHASHQEKKLLESPEALVATLRERFDLDVPEAASLWPAICARHEVLFGAEGMKQ